MRAVSYFNFAQCEQALGCEITMPIGPQPWTPMFGMMKDRYGIDWMVSGVY